MVDVVDNIDNLDVSPPDVRRGFKNVPDGLPAADLLIFNLCIEAICLAALFNFSCGCVFLVLCSDSTDLYFFKFALNKSWYPSGLKLCALS